MKNLSLKAKKGFSLIELLVVIAIIGILSAVGITTYSGYTANAKKQATTGIYSQVVSLINAEEAKCASGAGNYVWGGACTSDPAEASVLTYFNTTLGMKNPYATASDALVSHTAATWNTSNANGSVQVYHDDTNDQWTIIADIEGTSSTTTDDKSITTTAY